jgi:hypothetical protein
MNKINFYLESRLAAVKKRAADWAKHNPEGAYKSALDWQVKYSRKGWIKYDTANSYNEAGDLCSYNLDGYNATPIQDIGGRRCFDYTGYYADSFQHELIKPYVVTIKAGKKGVFICPAIAYDNCDVATIYFSQGQFAPNDSQDVEHDAAMMDAARIADRIAEREAESSREADAQFQAEQEAENIAEAIKDARQTARGLIAAIKAQRRAGIDLKGAICDALTDKLREYRREIVKARERREALKNNFWLAVEGGY